MTRTTTRLAALAALLASGLAADRAWAVPTTTTVNLNSVFTAQNISATGTLNITTASGTVHASTSSTIDLGFGLHTTVSASTDVGISSGGPQNIGLSMTPVSINSQLSNSSTAQLSYDNSKLLFDDYSGAIDSLHGTLLNASTQVNTTINTSNPLNITGSVSLLGFPISISLPVSITVNGQITSATFTSSGADPLNGSNAYSIPGTVALTLQGTVTATTSLLGIPINLGTLATISPTTLNVDTNLPGFLLLGDTTGGAGPYPANMSVLMLAGISQALALDPLSVPIALSNFSSGSISNLNITGNLTANLSLSNPAYSFNGTASNAIIAAVPEPSSLVLGGMSLLGMAAVVVRRKRAA